MSAGLPDSRLQRTALRTTAEPERWQAKAKEHGGGQLTVGVKRRHAGGPHGGWAGAIRRSRVRRALDKIAGQA